MDLKYQRLQKEKRDFTHKTTSTKDVGISASLTALLVTWDLSFSQRWLWRILSSGGITPCSLLKVNRRFGRTCRLCLPGRRINKARNQHAAGSKFVIFDEGNMFLRNIGWLSTDYAGPYRKDWTWYHWSFTMKTSVSRLCEVVSSYNLSLENISTHTVTMKDSIIYIYKIDHFLFLTVCIYNTSRRNSKYILSRSVCMTIDGVWFGKRI
jgi:hypothetical protein